MLIIERAATLASLIGLDPNHHVTPHFRAVMNGATKGRRLAGSTVTIPCAAVSRKSGIRTGLWMVRYAQQLADSGSAPGFLFGSETNPTPKLSDFEDDFYRLLERVQQARPDLIPPNLEVREEFGILRSLRRGVTAHAINIKVPDKLIELINRWRVELER